MTDPPAPDTDYLASAIHGSVPEAKLNGDPTMSVGSGRAWYKVVDLRVSVPGPPLIFARTHRSQGGISTSGGEDASPLGTNWSHNFETKLTVINSSPGLLRLIDADQNAMYFRRSETGSSAYVNISGIPGSRIVADGDIWRRELVDGSYQEFDEDGRLTKNFNRAGLEQTVSYDGYGRLAEVADERSGRSLVFTYESEDPEDEGLPIFRRIHSVAAPGSEVEFSWSVSGSVVKLDSATNPVRVENYTYTVDDPFDIDVETAYLDVVEYCPLGAGACVTVNDFDFVDGRLTSLTRADGGQYTVDYTDQTHPTITNVAEETVSTYTIGHQGGVPVIAGFAGASCGSCGGGGSEFELEWQDPWRRPTARVDAEDVRTEYGYDDMGSLVKLVEAAGDTLARTTQYEYAHPVAGKALLEKIIAPSASGPSTPRVTEYFYEDEDFPNLVTKVVVTGLTETGSNGSLVGESPTSVTTEREYYASNHANAGQLRFVLGPGEGQKTEYIYASNGDLTDVRRYTSGETYVSTSYGDYTSNGLAQEVTDPNEVVTTREFDPANRVTSSTITVASVAETTTSTYDLFGNVATTTHPLGNTLTRTYDEKSRLELTQNGAGDQIVSGYDTLDRKLSDLYKISDDTKRTIEYGYTPETGDESDDPRLVRQVTEVGKAEPGGSPVEATSHVKYDARGKRKVTVDASGKALAYTFDVLGRIATVTQGTGVTTYGYDAMDNLVSVEDANGNVTSYAYDDWGRVIKVVSPDSGTTLYRYYPDTGTLAFKRDARGAGSDVEYAYDLLNRSTSVAYDDPATPDLTYTYDSGTSGGLSPAFQVGRLAKVVDGSGTTIFSYDEAGRTLYTAQFVAGVGSNPLTTEYDYDKNGNVETITYPGSNRVLSFTYDDADRPLTATFDGVSVVSAFSYAPFGPATGFALGNGIDTSISRGLYYEPLSVETSANSSPVDVLRREYALAANGNLASITDLPTSDVNDYDAASPSSYDDWN